MLYRGLNKYHFVPEYEGSERTSVMVPVALVLVVIMVIVRLFHA